MRIIACIEDPVVTEKILAHLDAKAAVARVAPPPPSWTPPEARSSGEPPGAAQVAKRPFRPRPQALGCAATSELRGPSVGERLRTRSPGAARGERPNSSRLPPTETAHATRTRTVGGEAQGAYPAYTPCQRGAGVELPVE
jgi:hypothetical protein